MPERPKRRKNNKNKRKNNKSNRTDVKDNNSIPNASENVTESVSSENLVCDKTLDRSSESLDIANVTPVKKICSDTGSNDPNENKNNEFKNGVDLILENNDRSEENIENYVVESPDQKKKQTPKLSSNIKSKSVDNDDSPTIVEITDDDIFHDSNVNLPLIDSNNVVISDVECDVLWQNVDDLVDFNVQPDENHIKGALSITTIPLNIAQCNQTKSLSPEEESSLRSYLKTLNLSTNQEYASTSEIKSEIEEVINREIKHRLRKRGSTDDNFLLRVGPSRSLALDVIDEEGSGESSLTSRRQSSLIDKKSDNEELEDDVFEPKTKEPHQSRLNIIDKRNFNSHTIPQECIRVDAKIKEPEITEARGSWTTKIVEKITGAELVYLTDSSSSTSSIYDVNEDNENSEDSDRSVRIITPTIEVTDTEKLLTDLSKIRKNETTCNVGIKGSPVDEETLKVAESVNNNEQKDHEIVIESTENIKTNLFVKDLDQNKETSIDESNEIALQRSPKAVDKYDLEMKVLKCELNDAINNLIKEVSSDSESNKDCSNEFLSRQDSSSSVGSSQCTAKYNPTYSSLNDVSGIIQDSSDNISGLSTHVKDVLEHVPESHILKNSKSDIITPCTLRDLCVQKISSLPYGENILEELAQVSTRLQYLSALSLNPLCITTNTTSKATEKTESYLTRDKLLEKEEKTVSRNIYTPPPLLPRRSSLKKSQGDKPKIPPKPDNIHSCLSPSQKMLMAKTNTTVIKESIKSTNNLNGSNNGNREKTDAKFSSSSKRSDESPFKSQTGSRLLSLICDTSINNNISSSLMKSFDTKRLNNIPKDENTNKSSDFQSKSDYFSSKKMFSSPKMTMFSPSFYESDDSSDYARQFQKNIQNERKYFHYSTGNLNSEIEDDVSSIQNMHRYCSNIRNERTKEMCPRRPSLPKDICDQQMEYIRQKEKEVDAEIRRLEEEKQTTAYRKGPRAPMISENDNNYTLEKTSFETRKTSKQSGKLSSLFSSSEEELLREKMYTEYVNQMAEREFRKEHKVIKITKPISTIKNRNISQSMPSLDPLDYKVNNRIEREFITKAKERWNKLGIKETEVETENTDCDLYREPKIIEHKIKVIEAGEEKDVNNLPNHLQDFVKFTVEGKEQESEGTGECEPGNPPKHVVVLCAVIILMLTVGRYILRLIRSA